MTDRMENAIKLAEKCWGKAMTANPEFVERYLELAEELLSSKREVLGDEFRYYCRENMLFRPAKLHHNTWVSGVKALNTLGWITSIKKVVPSKSHNHMPEVTLWRSNIFDGRPLPKANKELFS